MVKQPRSKLFIEIAKLKNNAPDEYKKILCQAHLLIAAPQNSMKLRKVEKDMDCKNSFRLWLMKNGQNKSSADWIINSFDILSNYAKEKKISYQSIWEITDVKQFKSFVNKLQSYKLFRVLNKELYKFLQNNAKLYVYFLKDNQIEHAEIDEFVITETDKELWSHYPDTMKQVYMALKEDYQHAYLTVEQICDTCDSAKEVIETILSNASWSEKLGDGYILGQNKYASTANKISLNANRAYEYEINKEIENILISAFRRGFRPDSIMDRKRFANIFEEKYGRLIKDEEIIRQVSKSCFVFDNRFFLPKALIDQTLADKIIKHIVDCFEEKDIIFYDVLFENFKDSFNSYIYSSQMLREYIKATFDGTKLYFYDKYFSYKKDAKPDIASEVENYLISIDRPCSYEEIYRELSHLKRDDIYSVIHYNNPKIIGNSKTEYFHIDIAHINDQEITKIEHLCEKLLVNSKYITCNEIIDKLYFIDSELVERLKSKFSTLGIRRILTYYLRNKFDVNTGVITKKGYQMTIKDVFADFAKTHSKFTVDDIQELANYTGTVPYWEAVHSNAIRVNEYEFVSDELLDFNVDSIDEAIAFYCDSYLPLCAVSDFMRFPSCGYPWNIYLLQQYVYRFSKVFKLEFLGFAKSSASGVIVKKQSGYPDFESIVIDALSKTNILSKNETLDFLCENGFITDRRFKKVEELLKKAVVIRKRNNEM